MPARKGKANDQPDKKDAAKPVKKKEPTKEQMEAKANEIKAKNGKSVEGIVAVGGVLRGFEESVVARCFKQFVKDYLGWSRTQVYRFMWASDRFEKCPNLEQFEVSALYVLS